MSINSVVFLNKGGEQPHPLANHILPPLSTSSGQASVALRRDLSNGEVWGGFEYFEIPQKTYTRLFSDSEQKYALPVVEIMRRV